MKTAIDWSQKPEPWRSVGRAFAAEAQRIAGKRLAVPIAELPDQNGIVIFSRRIRLKLTVGALAQRCGLAPSTLSKLEHGVGSISSESWARIDAELDRAEAKKMGKPIKRSADTSRPPTWAYNPRVSKPAAERAAEEAKIEAFLKQRADAEDRP